MSASVRRCGLEQRGDWFEFAHNDRKLTAAHASAIIRHRTANEMGDRMARPERAAQGQNKEGVQRE